MLDSNIDEQLSALGQVPANLSELVSRFVGDRPLTLAEVDALLANLTEAGDLSAPTESARAEVGSEVPAATAGAGSVASSAFASSRLAAAAAPLFDSLPPPPGAAPPVFETGSAPIDISNNAVSAFDNNIEYSETTAQAIVAAFDEEEVESKRAAIEASLEQALDALESSPAAAMERSPDQPVELDVGRRGRLGERTGSRRPDLDELLDQPLDALDFERTEPVEDESAEGLEHRSDAPTGAPPPLASGDDFEILVDDEILEIAEDDVEMVDDESN